MASERGLPLYPGVATATEAQRAWNMGLRLLKFFSAANLADYLAIPQVFACGGSWLTPADAVDSGDFRAITELAREAVAIARSAKR